MNNPTSTQYLEPTLRQPSVSTKIKPIRLQKPFSAKSWLTSPKRFRLLRNFSIVSLIAFLLATALLAGFYRHQVISNLVKLKEENNVVLTQFLSNKLWQDYNSFLSPAHQLNDEELAADPRISLLYQNVLAQVKNSSVVKVKIFDLQGRTIFSTDTSQIGEKTQSPSYLSARDGKVISQLGRQDTFEETQNTLKNSHLISSYIPIYANQEDGEILGVFEVYSDVTSWLQRIRQTQYTVILGSLLILALLYAVIFLFIKRADKLLKEQYQKLQQSEVLYRQQANDLEHTLANLRQTQAHMIQSEKMSALGEMVAEVAHGINNPVNFVHGNLTYIAGYTQELIGIVKSYQKHYPNPPEELKNTIEAADLDFLVEDLTKIWQSMKVGTTRIREIVLSLRRFSRLDEAAFKEVDVHEGLNSTLVLLHHRLKTKGEGSEIQIVKEYSPLPRVECYAGQLNQVFMNILCNAIEAFEEASEERDPEKNAADPNTIRICTSKTDQGKMLITISDNGPGMSEAVRLRLFDPFFTTKLASKGTGLGLSICYQIVTQEHKGNLWCDSTPGIGTTIGIEIPIHQK
jgi:signal transduction histidine kinase